MKTFKQINLFSILIVVSLFLSSCNKDDDEIQNDRVTIEDGQIAFDVSGYQNTSLKGEAVYYLNNQYNTKYFQISDGEGINHNDAVWYIRFEQNSNDELAIPAPGKYPLTKGLKNTYDQTSFNATISVWTDPMTETGTTFGGNKGKVEGTLTIVSSKNDIIKGTFSFEAFSENGDKITVSNGQFAAPKNTW